MTKLDFKKTDKPLYSGKVDQWVRLSVPEISFVAIEGAGDPNGPGYAAALAALYPTAYGLKFMAKAQGADFVVPPLEALWWAEDPTVFVSGAREDWRWQVQLRVPDTIDESDFQQACETVRARLTKKEADTSRLSDLFFHTVTEGDSLQTLHVGPYTDEAEKLADLHQRIMPDLGLTFNGLHHEIYLSDPRRTAPEKLRTILRQPVKSTG
ncbi:GyrI-like domain-containing protein [uncultured Shimia sp.]|uniref:GyrI-like domain-containing protein n=1 Tax=uncultured Shimia sp. TaxID=573152 RepID=UPI002633E649|nr:GyrI-like domain-containing protein [uncultured Shimia sp.]